VLKACSNFVGGWVQGGDNLDRAKQTARAILHIGEAQGEIWGSSARNRAFLGTECNPVHFMQIAQRRINTAYFASC
jgi:hypothetical protein